MKQGLHFAEDLGGLARVVIRGGEEAGRDSRRVC